MQKGKKIVIQILKITVAVSLIYWLWSNGKLDFSSLRFFFSPVWAFLGLFLVGLNIFFCSERWRLLLQMQDRRPPFRSAFRLSLIGIFFNYAMPGGVGGDVVKAFYFHKDHPHSKVIALTSVLMDRVMGLYSMILMGLFVMIYDWNHVRTVPQLKSLFFFILLLAFSASLGLALLFSSKVYSSGALHRFISRLPMASRFHKLYESFFSYGKSPSLLFKVMVYSWISQIVSISFLILAGELSGESVPWATYFLVAPLGFIVAGLPITPAGIGISQAAFYFLFNVYLGRVTNLGPTTTTAFQVVQLLWGLFGAYFYLRRKEPLPTDFGAEETSIDSEYAPSR